MTKDAEELKPALLEKNEVKDGIIFKIKKDPRITGLGAFLRRSSIDELPQLFNVLKGEMSLVGPRPPTPDEVEKYNHFHMDRLSIRPGITGLSQIRARSKLTFRRWVKWDLWYVNNWSFRLDLQILWWTIPAVINGEGAY
jgi:lipopolysaccharide/colanic/teichoic acid biosynthesis glycosyltransferase